MNLRAFLRARACILLLGLCSIAASDASAAPFAYITNQSGTVSVVDIATSTVAATIPVGPTLLGVAVNSAGTRAYVANFGANGVTVIDTATNTVVHDVTVPGNAVQGVAVSADGSRVYAVGSSGADGQVATIDTATDTVVSTLVVTRVPRSVAVSLDGSRVYVGHSVDNDNGSVSVIDTASNSVVATIPVSAAPWGIVANPAGTRVYVTHQQAGVGHVTVIDAHTNAVIATPAVPGGSYGIAIDHAGSRIYVTNTNFNSSVSVLDALCDEVIGNIPLPLVEGESRFLYGISVAPDDSHVYVATTQPNHAFNSVAVIRTSDNAVVGDVPVDTDPWAVGVFISPGAVGVPPPGVPIHVTGIELTQAIQDLANDVPLISGKRTFARVYVKSDTVDYPNVTATLSGLGAFTDGGGNPVVVPLGTLVPSNAGGPRISVKAAPKRNIVDDSFLFELPWNWMSYESLRVGATLSQPAGPPPSGSCRHDLEAEPGSNIELPTHLKVAFVRMSYQFPDANVERVSSSEQLQTESWMRRAYPLGELSPTPDVELFDPLLGAWVERTAQACLIAFEGADRNLCAHYYTTARLGSLYASTTLFGFADGHVIDDLDVVYGLIPQHFTGADPEPYFTRGACCTNSIGAGPSSDDDYASHEIGHFLGRMHPVPGATECGHSASDPNYPYASSFIAPPASDPETALAGFDGGDASLLKPARVLPAAISYDIMGYCSPTTWISDYTYRWLYICLLTLNQGGITAGCPAFASESSPTRAMKRAPQAGDWLLVYGHIAADRSSAALIDVERTDAIFSSPPLVPGDFSIRLIGDGGAVLADYAFTPAEDADAVIAGVAALPLSFGQAVPFVAGAREVRIVDTSAGDAVLASQPVSASAPTIANVVAQAGTGSSITLTWTASDIDGDPLRFDVLVARNGGASLQPFALGLAGAGTTLDTASLGGGDVAFRVVASDGLLTAHADSNTITIANKPPQPEILSPGSGAHVTLGQSINLDGRAKDAQDGTIADASLGWSSAQGALGTGAHLALATLPLGANALTLTATNSVGLAATRSVTVFVDADPIVLGPTLIVGPGQIGWHIVAGELAPQLATLDIDNRGGGTLQFTISSDAAWLSVNALQGTAPATVTVTANPAGFAEGVAADATLTIAAVGNPSQTIRVPVRLEVGNTFVVGNGARPPPDPIYRDGFDGS